MNIQPYNEDQKDTLKEIVNIAMGQAGNSLARILDVFVALSVPKIELIAVNDIEMSVNQMMGGDQKITAVRQAFYNNLHGEAIVIFKQGCCNELSSLMGYDDNPGEENNQELLLEVANILAGSCLNGIGEQLGTELSYAAPTIMAENAAISEVLNPQTLPWPHALLLAINFRLEDSDFESHLLIFMTEDTILSLRDTLDIYLEAI